LKEISDRLKEHGLNPRPIRSLNRASNDCMLWTNSMAERKMKHKPFKFRPLMEFIPQGEKEPWQIEEEEAFRRAGEEAMKRRGEFMWYDPEYVKKLESELEQEMTPSEVAEAEEDVELLWEAESKKKGTSKLKEFAKKVRDFMAS
jgi:hypothetical protein